MTIEAIAMGERFEHDHYCEGCSLIEVHACQCSHPDRLTLCSSCQGAEDRDNRDRWERGA